MNAVHLPFPQLSQQFDGLLGMLCADATPSDRAAIQQTLKHLEEKLKSVGKWIGFVIFSVRCITMGLNVNGGGKYWI